MQINFELGRVSVEFDATILDEGVSPQVRPLKYTVETPQNKGLPAINRLKITNKGGALLMLFDVIDLLQPLWIVNPDKSGDQPDLFTTAYTGAQQENMEDITVTPDRIGGKVAAIVTGKARIGTQLYPTLKAIWGPECVSGIITEELIVVSSFFSILTTAKFLDNLKFEVRTQ